MTSNQQSAQTPNEPPKDRQSALDTMRQSLNNYRFNKYIQTFVNRYEYENAVQFLYEKLEATFKHDLLSSRIEKMKENDKCLLLKSFKNHVESSSALFGQYYEKVHGLKDGQKIVQDIFLPKVLGDIQYLIDNHKAFAEHQIDIEGYFANNSSTIRNTPFGIVLIASNESLENTVLNIAHCLMAGNHIVLYLGDRLNTEEVSKFFEGFQQQHGELIRRVDSSELDQIQANKIDLILSIGDSRFNQKFCRVAARCKSGFHAIGRRNNIAIIEKITSVENARNILNDIHDNKMMLNGAGYNSISHIFVNEKLKEDFVSNLRLVVDREFEFKNGYENYFGTNGIIQTKALLESGEIQEGEVKNQIESDEKGFFKPLIVLNPQNPSVSIQNNELPIFIVHSFKNEEDLISKVNQMDREAGVGNVHYFSGGQDIPTGEYLALRLRCKSFHYNGINPHWRNSTGSNSAVVSDVSLLSGYNGISLFSKRQLAVRPVFKMFESIRPFPLDVTKTDYIKRLYVYHRVRKSHIVFGAAFTATVAFAFLGGKKRKSK